MESGTIAFEAPMEIDAEQTQRGLAAVLTLASVSVWGFVLMATAQAFIA
jgi:hypothetical protein